MTKAEAKGGDVQIKAGLIWMNGAFVPQEEAKTSVLSHALHYGTSVFEGIRAYETPKGPAVFRLKEHVRRFYNSAKVLRMEIPFAPEELEEAIKEVVRRNGYRSCYIRPLAWMGAKALGVNPLPNNPAEVTNKNLLADYELALRYFREELETDYASAKEAYTEEPYKSTGEFDEVLLAGNTMKEFEDVFLCGMSLDGLKKKLGFKNIKINRDGGYGLVEILTEKNKVQ